MRDRDPVGLETSVRELCGLLSPLPRTLLIEEWQTARATLCEVREHGTNAHWYELEMTSTLLNRKLSDYVQARTPIVRGEVEKIASAFIAWCSEVVRG